MKANFSGKTCIVGIGETEYTRWGRAKQGEFALALEAIQRAVADAGLSIDQIDGFASYSDDRNQALRLSNALGKPVRFVLDVADDQADPRTGTTVKNTYTYSSGALASITDQLSHTTTINTVNGSGQPLYDVNGGIFDALVLADLTTGPAVNNAMGDPDGDIVRNLRDAGTARNRLTVVIVVLFAICFLAFVPAPERGATRA